MKDLIKERDERNDAQRKLNLEQIEINKLQTKLDKKQELHNAKYEHLGYDISMLDTGLIID